MGKEGVEPSRVAARDPKSRLSANSSTSPVSFNEIIRHRVLGVNPIITNSCSDSVCFEYNEPP